MEIAELKEFGQSAGLFFLAAHSLYLAAFSLLQKVVNIDEKLAVSGQVFSVVLGLFVILYAFLYQKKSFIMKRHVSFWQVFIPFGLFSFISFQYVYETTGEVFTLFYSPIYKYLLCAMVLGCFLYGAYCFLKKKEGILLSTVILTACYRVFIKPAGTLNVDFFHTGEMSVPWQQMEEFGKLPFWELIPIHGMCDYYYSLINKMFFDGSYLAMNAAMTVGNLLLAVLLACVLYVTTQKKEMALVFVYFFMPFMIHGAGIRYIFMFVLFFVLFSSKMRENGLRYLWWYVFLAILAIAWNVSIGGAAAAAFFVGVILFYLKEIPMQVVAEWKEFKRRNRFLVLWGLLIAFGISFIPLFIKMVIYLKENSGTTWMANGMAMVEEFDHFKDYFLPSFFAQGEVPFLQIFGFLIPFAVCILLAVVSKSEYLQKSGREFAVILFVCFMIIANYAFVRFDSGLRSGVISVFFLVVILYTVLNGKESRRELKWYNEIYLALFLIGWMLTGTSAGIDTQGILTKGQVESTTDITIMGQNVEDPIVYVTGDSVGMKNLGTGFIGGNTLQNLQNIQYVLNSELTEKRAYLDMTNAVANYQLMNAEMVLPYTSGYNISNEQMQQNAIQLLEEQEVELILLAPYIRFDEATISLRSPKLYEYFLEAGYEPYVYENVIYMKRGNSFLFEESNGEEAFAQLMHKEALQMLPAVWGNSEEAIETLEKTEIESEQSVVNQVIENRFAEAVSGQEIDFIEITLPDYKEEWQREGKEEETVLTITFATEDMMKSVAEGAEELRPGFDFYLKGEKLLIPVFSSPYWKQNEEIVSWSMEVKEGNQSIIEALEKCEVTYYCYP